MQKTSNPSVDADAFYDSLDMLQARGSTAGKTRFFDNVVVPPTSYDAPQPAPNRDLVTLLLYFGLDQSLQVAGEPPRRPKTLILSCGRASIGQSLGERASVTVVHPDISVVRDLNARPLASKAAVRRTLVMSKKHPNEELLHYTIRPGTEFLCRPLDATGLSTASFERIIVEQAHRADLHAVVPEVARLAQPGALIAFVGYMPMTVHGAVGSVLDWTDRALLRRLMKAGERYVLDGFGSAPFPFAEAHGPDEWKRNWKERIRMEARWSLVELVRHLDDWPALRGLDRVRPFEGWHFRQLLKDRWGSPKTKRKVTWAPAIRFGIALQE